jgi:hypothetical protein
MTLNSAACPETPHREAAWLKSQSISCSAHDKPCNSLETLALCDLESKPRTLLWGKASRDDLHMHSVHLQVIQCMRSRLQLAGA